MPPRERQTRQRTAIRDAIADAGTPLSPREILEKTRERIEGIGLATVYRTIKLLIEDGAVQTVEIPGEGPRFELAGKDHHHHFCCKKCRRVFEIEGCPGDMSGLVPKGFKLDYHEIVLFGCCPECVAGKEPM